MKIRNLLLGVFLILCCSFLRADEKPKFAHEEFKVKPHPKTEFGTLKNGFRYVLLPNKTPEKRVLMYLFVNSGSLNEKDNQQGLAHFLEHMAFNGTKNYPGDSMITFFKKIGMDFGGDTNAFTDFSETVYSLNLPEANLMKDGISIMSDYAMNMSLTSEEIEKERGVILSEKRDRDDIDSRIQYQSFQFVLPDCIIAKRFPIGLEDSIKAFPRESFVDYYTTWYRPENMVLIVVGDIESKKWDKAIGKAFDSFKSKAPKREAYALKDVGHKGEKINYYYEKEATHTNVEIGTVVIKDPEKKSFQEISKVELAEAAATFILNKRLSEMLTQKDCPLMSGSVSAEIWLKSVRSGSFEGKCKPENWKATLILIENELRKALEFGFTDQELLIFKKETFSQLDNSVNTMSTQESQSYIGQILHSLSEERPFLDATQNRDLMKPLLEKLSKVDALNEFKKYWNCDHRLISVSGNAEIKDAVAEIKKVMIEARSVAINAQKDEVLVAFPYEPKPNNPGKIVNKEEFPEFGFTRITFENHVVVNFKKTDYKKNSIAIDINLGTGALSAPIGKEAIVHLSSLAINEGGLEKLSKTELVKTLAGKNVMAYFSVGANAFEMQAETTPEDFELNLQLCRATLLNPGFRNEADEVIKKSIEQIYKAMESDISANFQNTMMSKISGGNPALFLPERKVLEAITLDDMKTWLTGQLKDCAIEINIVGDIDLKKVPELVATYFGSLLERKKIESVKLKDLGLTTSFNVNENFRTKIKKAMVFMMIPTVDFRQIEEVRQLNLLGKILEEKTMKLIREKLAISYSPGAGHSFNQDYKNFCYLQFMADVEPQNVVAAQNAFESIIKDAFEKGFTAEDLEAVRKPTINQIKDYVKTNEYWLGRVLSGSVAEPENLKIAASFIKSYESITIEQINAAIKKYLILEKKSVYILQAVSDETEKTKETK